MVRPTSTRASRTEPRSNEAEAPRKTRGADTAAWSRAKAKASDVFHTGVAKAKAQSSKVLQKAAEVLGTETLVLTPLQLRASRKLRAQWKELPPAQQEAVRASLRAEDEALFSAIQQKHQLFAKGKFIRAKDTATPRDIDELRSKTGWAEDSWQVKLLRSLDGAGFFEKDGKVTASEIITGLRNPENPEYLTTSMVGRLKKVIEGQGGVELSELKEDWKRELCDKADQHGDDDNRISADEIQAYLDAHPDLYNRLAMQNIAVMLHEIAECTGEPNPFSLGAFGPQLSVVRSAFTGSLNTDRKVATVIAQAITAHDIMQRGDLDRTDNFHADQLLPKELQALPADYKKSRHDMGHLAAAADAMTLENLLLSFSLLNMAPQKPKLNRFSWRYLEAAVRDLILASNGRAIVYTGNLYLDEKGDPLPDDEIECIGKNGRAISIPTHCFKSLVLMLPGGEITTMSWVIPNREDLPTDVESCKKLLHEGRQSIEWIERRAKIDLFPDLFPGELEKVIKQDKTATPRLPFNPGELEAAEWLWDDRCEVRGWRNDTQYQTDASLQWIAQAIENQIPAQKRTAA